MNEKTNQVSNTKIEFDNSDKKAIAKENQKLRKEVIKKVHEIDVYDIKCGIGACVPKGWLQKLASEKVYLLIYCAVGLTMGSYFTYTVSVISTIEKRFKISSKMSGIMLAGNDISQVILSVFISYFGNYGKRSTLLGSGVLFASLSCFITSLPNFIYGPGKDAIHIIESLAVNTSLMGNSSGAGSSNKNNFCHDPYVEDCKEHTEALGPILILFLGQFTMGICITIYYTIGLAYLDDNVKKEDSPIYFSISMIIRVLGPVLGYLLGSRCLAIFIDPAYEPKMSLRDPRWLGAWWLGFLLLSIILLLLGSLFLTFPRILPTTYFNRLKRLHDTDGTGEIFTASADIRRYVLLEREKRKQKKPTMTDLPKALKRLITNKVYMGYMFNTVLALLALVGYWNFKPKYLEFQFRRSASQANLLTGISGVTASIFGLGISGIIVKVFKPNARTLAGYSIFLTVIGSLGFIALIFIGCPKIEVYGPQNWPEDSSLGTCNTDCGCGTHYSPVCSYDNKTTYYSPCYAGCTVVNKSTKIVQYENCRCVQPTTDVSIFYNSTDISNKNISFTLAPPTESRIVRQGYCPDDCNAFYHYVMLTALNSMMGATGRIGGTLLFLRSVDEQDKALALGLGTVFISLLAFVPAPILMGAIIDSACIAWDTACGKTGNCWLYDSDRFRILIHVFPSVLVILSIIGDIIVYKHCHNVDIYKEGGDDYEEEKLGTGADANIISHKENESLALPS